MLSYTLIIGTVLYLCIKVVGYTVFAAFLNRLYACSNSIWKVGMVRTLLGVVLGLAHNAVFLSFFKISMGRAPLGGEDTRLYFAALVLLRFFEWGLIIFWFYDRKYRNKRTLVRAVATGTVWSFILDIPLLAGLFTVAASIC